MKPRGLACGGHCASSKDQHQASPMRPRQDFEPVRACTDHLAEVRSLFRSPPPNRVSKQRGTHNIAQLSRSHTRREAHTRRNADVGITPTMPTSWLCRPGVESPARVRGSACVDRHNPEHHPRPGRSRSTGSSPAAAAWMRRTVQPPRGIDSRACKEFRRDSFDVPTVGVGPRQAARSRQCPDARTVITSGLCRPESHGKPHVRGIRCPHRHNHNIGMIGDLSAHPGADGSAGSHICAQPTQCRSRCRRYRVLAAGRWNSARQPFSPGRPGAGSSSTRTGIRSSVAKASISFCRSGQGGTGLSGRSGS